MEGGAYSYAHLVLGGLLIYLLLMLAVGWWSQKKIKSTADFIVAGRRLPLHLSTGTLFATWFCGGLLWGRRPNPIFMATRASSLIPGAPRFPSSYGLIFAPDAAGRLLSP